MRREGRIEKQSTGLEECENSTNKSSAASVGQLDETASHQLIELLEEKVHCLDALLQLGQRKQDIIRERQSAALVSLLEEETAEAEALAQLTEERMRWGEAQGLDGQASLLAWVAALPLALQPAARTMIQQLQTLSEKLAAQNAVNEAMVRQELAFIQFAADVLSGPDPGDMTYGPQAAGARGGGHQGANSPAPPSSRAGAADRSLFNMKA